MPTKAIRRNGEVVGYRWGNRGKLYTIKEYGSKAKDMVERQAKAVYASGYKGSVVVKTHKRNGKVVRAHVRRKV